MRKITPDHPISDDVLKFLLCGHTFEDKKIIMEQIDIAEFENRREYRIDYSSGEYYIENGQIVKHGVNVMGTYINKKVNELRREEKYR